MCREWIRGQEKEEKKEKKTLNKKKKKVEVEKKGGASKGEQNITIYKYTNTVHNNEKKSKRK